MEIHATLGPSSSTDRSIQKLLRSGTDVIRLNLSHYQSSALPAAVKQVRECSASVRETARIACDIRGRKLRIGPLQNDQVELKQGQVCVLHGVAEGQEEFGNETEVWVNHPFLSSKVGRDTPILLDDGAIRVAAVDVDGNRIICRVEVGGVLPARSGLNIPGVPSDLPPLGDKDMADLDVLSGLDIDAVYLSYVEDDQDVRILRDELRRRCMSVPIFAKIERSIALANIDAIAQSADAICLARGDLGVEIPLADIPFAQRQIADRVKIAAKPFILAGEILLSLVARHIPARAELTDVAVALQQGVDGFILSDETAVGIAPAEAVQTLRSLIAGMTSHVANQESVVPGP